MAYRIDYGTKQQRSAPSADALFRRICLTVCFFSLFLTLVCGFWPEGQAFLRNLLIPEGAMDAAEVFAEDLRVGQNLSSGLKVFFRSILHGSKN